ncbi:MAG: serine/threonine-protein kinase [Gemmatimonadales bacterium]
MWLPDHTLRHLGRVATWPEFTGDRYTVVRELGRGGMGTVYLAHDKVLLRDVALKVSNAASDDPSLEARMQTEAHVLARLEHPGIVPIHDVGTLADGRLYYVMKLVRGRTLEGYLSDRLDLPERLRVFERVCEPVAFAHAHGVVHRDLKPGNVMVGSFGEVLVMDWGVAKVLQEGQASPPATPSPAAPHGSTDPGTVLGTRGFMSPEQARGRVDLTDQRSDVYALGAMLFWLLTGEEPLDATEAAEPLGGDRLGQVPRRLRAICLTAAATDAADRYPGVAELVADVARFRAGQSVTAYHETVLDRGVRLLGTYRVPVLLVLAYLVMRVLVAWWAG